MDDIFGRLRSDPLSSTHSDWEQYLCSRHVTVENPSVDMDAEVSISAVVVQVQMYSSFRMVFQKEFTLTYVLWSRTLSSDWLFDGIDRPKSLQQLESHDHR